MLDDEKLFCCSEHREDFRQPSAKRSYWHQRNSTCFSLRQSTTLPFCLQSAWLCKAWASLIPHLFDLICAQGAASLTLYSVPTLTLWALGPTFPSLPLSSNSFSSGSLESGACLRTPPIRFLPEFYLNVRGLTFA